jgi:hypothetical protein
VIRVLGGLTITRAALLFVGAVALGVEVWALFSPQALPLISPTMRADGLRWIVWPAGWGVLGGHFWSPSWLRFEWALRAGPYVLVVYGVGVLAFDFFGPRVSPDTAFLLMLASVFVGAVFWSQR